MIKLLAAMANNPKKPDQVRLTAARELLDRGYGRPVQPVGGDATEPITVIVKRFVLDLATDNESGGDEVGQMVGQSTGDAGIHQQ